MKLQELRKILKSLVKKIDGYIFYKDMFVKPIGNSLLKGISFDLSSSGKVSVTFFVQPLYVLDTSISYTFGKELRDRGQRQWWEFNIEDQDFLIDVISMVDSEIFNPIVNSIDFYNNFVTNKEVGLRYKEGLALALCKEEDEDSSKVLINLIDEINSSEAKSIPWVEKLKNNLEFLLNSSDSERKNILEGWEKETISNLKLEKIIC